MFQKLSGDSNAVRAVNYCIIQRQDYYFHSQQITFGLKFNDRR